MNNTLISKINELRQYDTEREWFEFKEIGMIREN